MQIEKLSEPLPVEMVEFRVQSINKGGYATLLAYKDARADMDRLDDVCGKFGWERIHTRDNYNCTVRIWDAEHGHWVSKEDTGTESYSDAQKGLASDSFKRACFNWGIGRELYDYPLIQIKLREDEWNKNTESPKATWKLNLRAWVWYSEFDDHGKITFLAGRDDNGVRFKWGVMKKDAS